jgi:hypothetical protein
MAKNYFADDPIHLPLPTNRPTSAKLGKWGKVLESAKK